MQRHELLKRIFEGFKLGRAHVRIEQDGRSQAKVLGEAGSETLPLPEWLLDHLPEGSLLAAWNEGTELGELHDLTGIPGTLHLHLERKTT